MAASTSRAMDTTQDFQQPNNNDAFDAFLKHNGEATSLDMADFLKLVEDEKDFKERSGEIFCVNNDGENKKVVMDFFRFQYDVEKREVFICFVLPKMKFERNFKKNKSSGHILGFLVSCAVFTCAFGKHRLFLDFIAQSIPDKDRWDNSNAEGKYEYLNELESTENRDKVAEAMENGTFSGRTKIYFGLHESLMENSTNTMNGKESFEKFLTFVASNLNIKNIRQDLYSILNVKSGSRSIYNVLKYPLPLIRQKNGKSKYTILQVFFYDAFMLHFNFFVTDTSKFSRNLMINPFTKRPLCFPLRESDAFLVSSRDPNFLTYIYAYVSVIVHSNESRLKTKKNTEQLESVHSQVSTSHTVLGKQELQCRTDTIEHYDGVFYERYTFLRADNSNISSLWFPDNQLTYVSYVVTMAYLKKFLQSIGTETNTKNSTNIIRKYAKDEYNNPIKKLSKAYPFTVFINIPFSIFNMGEDEIFSMASATDCERVNNPMMAFWTKTLALLTPMCNENDIYYDAAEGVIKKSERIIGHDLCILLHLIDKSTNTERLLSELLSAVQYHVNDATFVLEMFPFIAQTLDVQNTQLISSHLRQTSVGIVDNVANNSSMQIDQEESLNESVSNKIQYIHGNWKKLRVNAALKEFIVKRFRSFLQPNSMLRSITKKNLSALSYIDAIFRETLDSLNFIDPSLPEVLHSLFVSFTNAIIDRNSTYVQNHSFTSLKHLEKIIVSML